MINRTLVTGVDGFIGSHLTELLVQQGCQVRALCQYNSFNHWGWLEDVSCLNDIEVVSGDVRDPHYCMHITKDIVLFFIWRPLLPSLIHMSPRTAMWTQTSRAP